MKVLNVIREGKRVKEVRIGVNNLELIFKKDKGKVVEVARIIKDGKIFDRERFFIPDELFKKLIRKVYAIFRG
jgi:hypothetical protein